MDTNNASLFESALSLPDGQRADLALQLLNSLKPLGMLSDKEPELQSEIARRLHDYDLDKSKASSLEDVAERVGRALRGRKDS